MRKEADLNGQGVRVAVSGAEAAAVHLRRDFKFQWQSKCQEG
jgi:hypothetical protein